MTAPEKNTECLFPKTTLPRRKNKRLMHVTDAGGTDEGHHIHFKCDHCGHDNGWGVYRSKTITELKRGLPCPKCN